MAYVALGNLMWSPIHAKLKLGGGIVHADIMFFAGGGRMFHDAVQGIAFDAGFALDMFVTQASVTIRFDVARPDGRAGDRRRDPLHQQHRRHRRARAVDPDGPVMRAARSSSLVLVRLRVAATPTRAPIDKRRPPKQVAAADAEAPRARARPRCASIRRSPTGSRSSASGAARSIACSSSRAATSSPSAAATTRATCSRGTYLVGGSYTYHMTDETAVEFAGWYTHANADIIRALEDERGVGARPRPTRG